jgi:hypothetical protein
MIATLVAQNQLKHTFGFYSQVRDYKKRSLRRAGFLDQSNEVMPNQNGI